VSIPYEVTYYRHSTKSNVTVQLICDEPTVATRLCMFEEYALWLGKDWMFCGYKEVKDERGIQNS
jgi:hypothetical protein